MYALQPEPESRHRVMVLCACALVTIPGIGGLLLGASHLPAAPRSTAHAPIPLQMVSVSVRPPPSRPLPPPAPALPPPPAQPEARKPPKPQAVNKPVRPPSPSKAQPMPPTSKPQAVAPPTPLVVGLTLSSTAHTGHGPAMAVGNTLMGVPETVAQQAVERPVVRGIAAPATQAAPLGPSPEPASLRIGAPPEYPASAKQQGLEGVVVLAITIGVDGRVRSAQVLRGLSVELDASAVQAARNTLWTPATVGGRPVSSTRRFNVRFSLQG